MGRPKKIIETTEAASVTTETEPTVTNDGAVVADTVEVVQQVDDLDAMRTMDTDIGAYISKYVSPKYPQKYIAFPSQEDAMKGWHGWSMLALDMRAHTVRPVSSKEEACCTQGNVLCWKDRRRYEVEEEQKKKKLDEANRKVRQINTAQQAYEVDQQVRQMTGGMATVSPLAERDTD